MLGSYLSEIHEACNGTQYGVTDAVLSVKFQGYCVPLLFGKPLSITLILQLIISLCFYDYIFRNEIVSAVQNERVIIVAGDTGCGKSTQVPQYLHEAGFQNIGKQKQEI